MECGDTHWGEACHSELAPLALALVVQGLAASETACPERAPLVTAGRSPVLDLATGRRSSSRIWCPGGRTAQACRARSSLTFLKEADHTEETAGSNPSAVGLR